MVRGNRARRPRAGQLRIGLTLIESLIALSIFSVGILAVSQRMAQSGSVALRTELETLAAVTCQSELDRLSGAPMPQSRAPENELFELTTREFSTETHNLVRVEVTAHLKTNSAIRPVSVSRLMLHRATEQVARRRKVSGL